MESSHGYAELILGLRSGAVTSDEAAEKLRELVMANRDTEFLSLLEDLMRSTDRGVVEEIAKKLLADKAVFKKAVEMADPERIMDALRKRGEAAPYVSLLEFIALARPVEALAAAAELLEKTIPLIREEPGKWRKLYMAVVNGPLSMAPPRALKPILDMVIKELRGCCWEERAATASMIINTYPAEILCREHGVVERAAELLSQLAEEALKDSGGYRGGYVASMYRMLRGMCRKANTPIPDRLRDIEPLITEIGRRAVRDIVEE